jgi:hypothetical protein
MLTGHARTDSTLWQNEEMGTDFRLDEDIYNFEDESRSSGRPQAKPSPPLQDVSRADPHDEALSFASLDMAVDIFSEDPHRGQVRISWDTPN